MAAIGGADPYATLGASDDGNNWLGVILGMQGQVNPQKAADQLARLATLNAADNNNAVSGIPYYLTQSNRTYGLRDFAYHLSVPVGGVYTNAATGMHTCVAYNSAQTPQTVQVLDDTGNIVDSFSAAARDVTVFTPFAAIDPSGTLQITGTPGADAFGVTQSGSTITATLGGNSQSFSAAAVTNGIVVTGLAGDDTLDFAGPFTQPVTLNGGVGNDTLNVNDGTFTFNADAQAGTASLSINVAAGASVIFNSTQHLAALSVSGNATLGAAASKRVLVTQSLSIPAGGRLDLTSNDLLLDYTGVTQIAGIQQLINTARAGGAWTGAGLTSAGARNNPQHNTTLGAMEASDYRALNAANTTFDGVPIDTTAVLIKYTWYGDTDFNGKVNFDDYVRTDSGFNNHRSGWLNGDFDGSGAVNFDDYVLIDLAFNTQSGTLRR
jgi:hypothetical protein